MMRPGIKGKVAALFLGVSALTGCAPEGPTYDDMILRGGWIEVEFDENGAPIQTSDGQAPRGFSVAGNDYKFYDAQAKFINRDTIEVWSDQVREPRAVRLSEKNNLINKHGLPAEPFSDDEWND